MKKKNNAEEFVEEITEFPEQSTFNEEDMSVLYDEEDNNGKG